MGNQSSGHSDIRVHNVRSARILRRLTWPGKFGSSKLSATLVSAKVRVTLQKSKRVKVVAALNSATRVNLSLNILGTQRYVLGEQ